MRKILIILLIFCFGFLLVSKPTTAFAQEYSLTIFAGNKKYVYYYPEIYEKGGKYFLKQKQEKIDRIVMDSYVFSKNATLSATSLQDLKVTKEVLGSVVDGDFLSMQIDTALRDREKKITAITKKVYPEIDQAYINRCLNLKGEFTTYFVGSSQDRVENITLAASKLNGRIIFSGEEFSFNKTVGKRTQENGFKNAKVIFDGQFVEGIGGGVCQVSTTLYNAVLLSGLFVSEFHPHSLAVGYVEKSFDAMVTDLWADLCFVNNTNGLVIIFAEAGQDYLTISLYGVDNYYSYKRVSVVEEEILPEDKIEYVGGLLKGEKVQKVFGKKGYKSKGFLEVYLNGELLEIKEIRSDQYKKIDNLILQGE